MVYLIGDSHTIMYLGMKPEIDPIHMGACTAYSLMSEHSFTNSYKIMKKHLSDWNIFKDTVIFGFGEIDCRVLIYYKHIKYGINSIRDMIDIVAYRYLSTLLYTRNLGFKIAVHGPIPAVRQTNEYKLEFYADDQTRAWISSQFNITLRELCMDNGIHYFDAHSLPYLKGNDGLIPKEHLLPDLVHVDPNKVPIQEDFRQWLKTWGILSDKNTQGENK